MALIGAAGLALLLVFHCKKNDDRENKFLTEFLSDRSSGSRGFVSLQNMLTLEPVVDEKDPGIACFDVKINYDSLQKIGILYLLVDPEKDGSTVSGSGEYQIVEKQKNGDCLIKWNTTYEMPGPHRLQADLVIQRPNSVPLAKDYLGPMFSFRSKNICEFDDDQFDSRGISLHAKLFDTNSVYTIEMQTADGKTVKTINGISANAEINEYWNLIDGNGIRLTNENEFVAVFHITNSVSGTAILKLSRGDQ